jgi:propionyl-CoA synthetase
VILKNGVNIDPQELQHQLINQVRQNIGAIAAFKTAIIVNRLPKTRSGKILRKLMRQIADGQDYEVPSTIEDPGCIDEIVATFAQSGVIANAP